MTSQPGTSRPSPQEPQPDHNTEDCYRSRAGLDVENTGLAADFESLMKYGPKMPRTEENGIMTKAG